MEISLSHIRFMTSSSVPVGRVRLMEVMIISADVEIERTGKIFQKFNRCQKRKDKKFYFV